MSSARLKADLANEGDDVADLDGLDSTRSSGTTSGEDDMKRAELILANAKKRLTVPTSPSFSTAIAKANDKLENGG